MPPVGIMMSGYAARARPSIDAQDDGAVGGTAHAAAVFSGGGGAKRTLWHQDSACGKEARPKVGTGA